MKIIRRLWAISTFAKVVLIGSIALILCLIGADFTEKDRIPVEETVIVDEYIEEKEQEKLEVIAESFPTDAEFMSEKEYEIKQGTEIEVIATCYCLKGNMANGEQVHWGAVASNDYPFGTRIYSEYWDHTFVVKDRIGHGTELDFWHEDCQRCIAFGKRRLNVIVLP